MTGKGIAVNLNRCIGCWTCAMACKISNHLPDEAWRLTVRTLGSGEGIDRPGGTWPELRMSWMPVYNRDCTLCAERAGEASGPFCVAACPTDALAYGDAGDPESGYSKLLEDARQRDFRVFELPAHEGTSPCVTYAGKR